MSGPSTDPAPASRNAAVRWFGRLQLLRLLGKSDRTTAWRVEDPRTRQELMLVLPRVQPAGPAELERWNEVVHRATRLDHPQIATAVDVGVQDGWPFALYDPRDGVTLADKLSSKGLPGIESAGLLIQLLQGLAFAHEAGVAHHDLQPYQVLLSEGGLVRVAGLGVAAEMMLRDASDTQAAPLQAGGLRTHRSAAERDVLASGILLHLMLTGQKPLDEADFGHVIDRLPPAGREMMRLPFATAHPVPEPLRAIANRATDRQARQRYRNARTLIQALEGWTATESGTGGGTLAVLQERVRHGGVMPGTPGAAARAERLARAAGQHTTDLADVVLEDPGLSFELLRMVNVAQARNAKLGSGEAVLTIRRAIAMLGLDAVRRSAHALREWPGSLRDEQGTGAVELLRLVDRCKRAGRIAKALRPAGYDGEVVYLVTLLQSLGRLVVHYHFADEASQIRRLMQPAPPEKAGDPEDPGMSEEGAAFAVLGADIDALGASVARNWGLDEGVMTMIRRQPLATAVRTPESDEDTLRVVASCANEVLDALSLPAARIAPALQKVVGRYGRLLNFGVRELLAALQAEPAEASRPDAPGTEAVPSAPMAAAAPGLLRSRVP